MFIAPTTTVAEMLVPAFAVPELPHPPRQLDADQLHVCALSGQPIQAGYPLKAVISSTTADMARLFPYPSGYVAPLVARALKASQTLRGNLCVVDTVGYRPFIGATYATTERPTWRDLLRALQVGQRTVVIITTESQKRLWHQSAVSTVGPHWQIVLNDQTGCRLVTVDYTDLCQCLALVETVYQLGVSKLAIGTNLGGLGSYPLLATVGIDTLRQYEAQLVPWRRTPTFAVALCIAQREDNP